MPTKFQMQNLDYPNTNETNNFMHNVTHDVILTSLDGRFRLNHQKNFEYQLLKLSLII